MLDILVESIAAFLQSVDIVGEREIPDGGHELLSGLCDLAEIAGLLHRRLTQLLAEVARRPQNAQYRLVQFRVRRGARVTLEILDGITDALIANGYSTVSFS